MVRRGQAGSGTDGAVDVSNDPACAADSVMVVVADSGFVASNGARRLNPPHQPGVGQGMQNVVDGLSGHVRQGRTHRSEN